MPKELQNPIQQGWETSKLGVALRIFGVVPKVGEKGVALKVGEKVTSHFAPLQFCSTNLKDGPHLHIT